MPDGTRRGRSTDAACFAAQSRCRIVLTISSVASSSGLPRLVVHQLRQPPHVPGEVRLPGQQPQPPLARRTARPTRRPRRGPGAPRGATSRCAVDPVRGEHLAGRRVDRLERLPHRAPRRDRGRNRMTCHVSSVNHSRRREPLRPDPPSSPATVRPRCGAPWLARLRCRRSVRAVPDRPYTIVSCAVSVDGYLDDASPEPPDPVRPRGPGRGGRAAGGRRRDPGRRRHDPRRQPAAAGPRPRPGRRPRGRGQAAAPAPRHPDRHRRPGPGRPLLHRPGHPLGLLPRRRPSPAAEQKSQDKAVVIDAGAELSLAAVLRRSSSSNGPWRPSSSKAAPASCATLWRANLADELRLAIAPFFVGDPSAPRFALPARYPHTAANPMTLLSLRRVGEVAVHHYRLTPTRPRAPPPRHPPIPESCHPRFGLAPGHPRVTLCSTARTI